MVIGPAEGGQWLGKFGPGAVSESAFKYVLPAGSISTSNKLVHFFDIQNSDKLVILQTPSISMTMSSRQSNLACQAYISLNAWIIERGHLSMLNVYI